MRGSASTFAKLLSALGGWSRGPTGLLLGWDSSGQPFTSAGKSSGKKVPIRESCGESRIDLPLNHNLLESMSLE